MDRLRDEAGDPNAFGSRQPHRAPIDSRNRRCEAAEDEIVTVRGPVTFGFYADGVCGIDSTGSTGTIWDCSRPLIESFVAGVGTLAVGQSTYVSYVTQSRDGQLPVGTVTSSLGNTVGGAVRLSGTPESRHTYTATHAGLDTVTLTVETPCGPATATLQITVR